MKIFPGDYPLGEGETIGFFKEMPFLERARRISL